MHTKSVLAALLAPVVVSAGLNDLAVRAGLKYFGTALRESAISSDSTYASILNDKSEFGQLVPENGQKWDATEATRGTFTYTSGDITANTAKKNGQGLRCHTMVWYSQLPSWVSQPPPFERSLQSARALLTEPLGLERNLDQGHPHLGHPDAYEQRHGPLQGTVLRLGYRQRGRRR